MLLKGFRGTPHTQNPRRVLLKGLQGRRTLEIAVRCCLKDFGVPHTQNSRKVLFKGLRFDQLVAFDRKSSQTDISGAVLDGSDGLAQTWKIRIKPLQAASRFQGHSLNRPSRKLCVDTLLTRPSQTKLRWGCARSKRQEGLVKRTSWTKNIGRPS